jgi:CubicO group peptidase (beta-lactamase class C family)
LAWPGESWGEGSPEDHGYDSALLEEVREYAFKARHNTQAVAIIKDGVLIAEWYAEDRDRDTPVTSWSVGKSVLSALFGVAVREGLLDLSDPIRDHVADWSAPEFEGITIQHLLEMQSGLQPNNSDPKYGLYGSGDQLAYSLDRVPSWEPGVKFSYVNEDSMVLGSVLADAFGKPLVEVAEEEVFSRIGMDAAWWTDDAGNALTYCCIDSTALDFARFGLLYARGGEWDGEQLVSTDFVDLSTSGISNYGYYGLHWWTFDGVAAAMGYHGQYIYVYPDDLVVVRFGTYNRVGDALVRDADFNNYHETLDYGPFDEAAFRQLILDAALETDPE